eukprot:5116433-Pleurochrysis_carterae.AAC.2
MTTSRIRPKASFTKSNIPRDEADALHGCSTLWPSATNPACGVCNRSPLETRESDAAPNGDRAKAPFRRAHPSPAPAVECIDRVSTASP